MKTDREGLFGSGTLSPDDPNGFESLGHSDFSGSREQKGTFDYNKEDRDPLTSPMSIFDYNARARHFRPRSDVEHDLASALTICDILRYERLMHQGQDSFVHSDKGFGPGIGHLSPKPIWKYDGYGDIYGHPDIELGHRFDTDDKAWDEAEEWSKKWYKRWHERCDCSK